MELLTDASDRRLLSAVYWCGQKLLNTTDCQRRGMNSNRQSTFPFCIVENLSSGLSDGDKTAVVEPWCCDLVGAICSEPAGVAVTADMAAATMGLVILNLSSVSRHRTLMNLFDKDPVVDKDAFVAPGASVMGDVHVGRGSSIWYGCVLRGDVNSIRVGSGTNIQDNALVHVAKSNISHGAVLHGCTVEDEAFVGMGATLLDGSYVEKNAMVAAGALVWGGNPAKFMRKLTEEEIAFISQSATNYTNLAMVHAAENNKGFQEIELEKLLRKKFARKDEEYDSMIGVVRETPVELTLPDNILPDKTQKIAS
ncbi:hypothetical protein E3N88_29971 [Mikania micrantha]|uniref:Uncharacterized protein n=1 Tax=Mikania micrantha TaxID=192012 RepID=A0A5N6MKW0_9ASTR|nr:hypothetical protein E3N88_29971 [Mikania micrantha]